MTSYSYCKRSDGLILAFDIQLHLLGPMIHCKIVTHEEIDKYIALVDHSGQHFSADGPVGAIRVGMQLLGEMLSNRMEVK